MRQSIKSAAAEEAQQLLYEHSSSICQSVSQSNRTPIEMEMGMEMWNWLWEMKMEIEIKMEIQAEISLIKFHSGFLNCLPA